MLLILQINVLFAREKECFHFSKKTRSKTYKPRIESNTVWKNNSKLTMNVCPSDVRFSGSATDDKCIVIWLKITNSCHLSRFVMPANLGFVSLCD